jgi:predicted AAA+ superfamily ATPase
VSIAIDGPRGVDYDRHMDGVDPLVIAATWSFWGRPPPSTVTRDVDLPARLDPRRCLVVQGVRRCGKSTLLVQMVERYRLDPARCAFLNLEDPRLSRALDWTTLDRLVDAFRARHGGSDELYFFLDEIQGVEGWQRWLRTQLERPRGNVFAITGSNAHLLSGELSSVLTGRHLTVELFPFDLAEVRRVRRRATVRDWLRAGGFPEPLAAAGDADRLLRQYFHDIVERDVRERVGARSSLPIRQVAQMVFESTGSELSLRRVAAATGIAVDTAGAYVEACEAAYLLFGCPFFAFSERKRAARNKKYYPVDTALRRVVVTPTGADGGKELECAVHLALRRRFGPNVYYWREKGEVDFVVHAEGRIVPVQVTRDALAERHERGLDAFYEHFPQAEEAVVVTLDTFEEALETLLAARPDSA